MKKAIFDACLLLAAAAVVYGNADFGKLPTKFDRIKYKKRSIHHNGKRFTYPAKWAEKGLPDDLRISVKGTSPSDELPVYTPDFKAVSLNKVNVTWFGHSSILLQMHGMNILIDPMFSERSSPFQWIGPKRFSRPSIGVEQLPHIDIVLITHDHYDHLDRLTISQLNAKTDRFIVPLGVENHLKRWHIPAQKITSLAWWEQANINGLEITCAPSRHFSGRGLVRHDTTLWCSWVLRDEYHSIFDSGDGSFGGHFKEIHDRFGNFDFALMEWEQYNKNWHYSHLYPKETVIDAEIIGAQKVMLIHWGAFILSNHGWDDPPERFVKEAQKHGLSIVTPHLCETICIDGEVSTSYWWREYN